MQNLYSTGNSKQVKELVQLMHSLVTIHGTERKKERNQMEGIICTERTVYMLSFYNFLRLAAMAAKNQSCQYQESNDFVTVGSVASTTQ